MTRGRRLEIEVPERDPDSHKGQNGLVLVIGGSKDYVGAPVLAGLAALRAGCDIVNIAAPEKAAWAINSLSPDLITTKLRGDYLSAVHLKKLVGLAGKYDAVLIGNGAGKIGSRFVNTLLKSLSGLQVPMVVDADAVKVANVNSMSNAVITPHAKELELFLKANRMTLLAEEMDDRKLSDSDRIQSIQNNLKGFFARNNTLLLKGRHDLVIAGNRSLVMPGGNAGMTVGGTGDILAGICAGYLSQTAEPFLSAGLASRDCKRIGDALMKKSNFGFGFIASDFLREVRKLKMVKV